MNMIAGFTFFRSYHESLKDLETDDRRELLEAIVNYVFDDIEPELMGFKKTIWTLMLPNLNTSKTKSKNAQKETKEKQTKNKKKTKNNQTEDSDLLENKNKKKNKKEDKEEGIEKRKEKEEESEELSELRKDNIVEFVESNFGRPLSPLEYEKILEWEKSYSIDEIKYAIEKSVLYNKKNFSYINAIIRDWKTNGLRTLQEIKDQERTMEEPRTEIKDMFDYNWLEGFDD